jgi:hypothetical protein
MGSSVWFSVLTAWTRPQQVKQNPTKSGVLANYRLSGPKISGMLRLGAWRAVTVRPMIYLFASGMCEQPFALCNPRLLHFGQELQSHARLIQWHTAPIGG